MQTSVRSDFFGKFHFSKACYKNRLLVFELVKPFQVKRVSVSLLHEGLIEGSDFG